MFCDARVHKEFLTPLLPAPKQSPLVDRSRWPTQGRRVEGPPPLSWVYIVHAVTIQISRLTVAWGGRPTFPDDSPWRVRRQRVPRIFFPAFYCILRCTGLLKYTETDGWGNPAGSYVNNSDSQHPPLEHHLLWNPARTINMLTFHKGCFFWIAKHLQT